MKSKIKNKKIGLPDPIDQKFIYEQEYAEQGFQLVDPTRDIPDVIDGNLIYEEEVKDTDWEKLMKKK